MYSQNPMYETGVLPSIRKFLDELDVSKHDWKDKAERWFLSTLLREIDKKDKPLKRVPLFSVGDEDIDNDNDSSSDSTEQKSEKVLIDVQTQCNFDEVVQVTVTEDGTLDDISKAWKNGSEVRPGDALRLLNRGMAKSRELESHFDPETAVSIRRAFVGRDVSFRSLPYTGFEYKYVTNTCCENVIGFVPIPVGVAGPLRIMTRKGPKSLHVPMATTEGALIASTNRGCSAISKSGGVCAIVHDDKMTRAPIVKFPNLVETINFKTWLDDTENYNKVKEVFDSTSRYASLCKIDVALNGNQAFVRFSAKTGDAMGMNMVSKACSSAIKALKDLFPNMEILSLSGNYCVDKKSSAINWVNGRGRSVVAECVLPREVVKSVLKTTPAEMAYVASGKLQHGSAMAGCLGGNNAHAANIVAAIFLATGQDAAQVVSSSMCSTRMEVNEEGNLYVSCSMPCVEVGTVGGGTILPPQNECLQLLSCAGPSVDIAGSNASFLAEVIAATVLAGELSLMAALVKDELVSSHMKLNRSTLKLYNLETPSLPAMPLFKQSQPGDYFRARKKSERAHCSNIL
ncbi:unnamed protein product [Auanema sp. JU1783]|nr:unnamed protein product [Auanema sp. JU1783]